MTVALETVGRGRGSIVLRRFPVTTLLALQYVPTALIPAWVTDNPSTTLITTLIIVALGSALSVELMLQPFHTDQPSFDADLLEKTSARLPIQARWLSIAAILVTVMATLTGLGSYGAGIGALTNSPIASLITPFRPWTIIAATLHVVSWKAGRSSRGHVLRWLAILLAAELIYAATTAIIAPLVTTFACVTAMCTLLGLLRARWAVALILIGALAWPAVAEVRNAIRVQQGGAAYGAEYNPGERLRLDLAMEPLRGTEPGIDLGQLGPAEILRYGLIPRALDPGRPPITTGREINGLVKGTTTSSYTFTVIGNVWLLHGAWGLGLYCAGAGLLVGLILVRRTGAWGFAAIALSIQYLVSVGATYPESLVSFVQSLVSLTAAWVFVHLPFTKSQPRSRSQRPLTKVRQTSPRA